MTRRAVANTTGYLLIITIAAATGLLGGALEGLLK